MQRSLEEEVRGTPMAELRAMFLCLGAHVRGDRAAEERHRDAYRRERAKRVIDLDELDFAETA